MFTVQFTSGTTYKFPTLDDAESFAEAMEYKFATHAQVYPSEPEEGETYQPFDGVCEQCRRNPAAEGAFLCMECISSMVLDMARERGEEE